MSGKKSFVTSYILLISNDSGIQHQEISHMQSTLRINNYSFQITSESVNRTNTDDTNSQVAVNRRETAENIRNIYGQYQVGLPHQYYYWQSPYES